MTARPTGEWNVSPARGGGGVTGVDGKLIVDGGEVDSMYVLGAKYWYIGNLHVSIYSL